MTRFLHFWYLFGVVVIIAYVFDGLLPYPYSSFASFVCSFVAGWNSDRVSKWLEKKGI